MTQPFSSGQYWDDRYSEGGSSGTGSYGRLAVYKANFVNTFVHQHDIRHVIEFGSGDGHQASLFSIRHYMGVDVSPTAVEHCRSQYMGRPDWTFKTVEDYRADPSSHQMALSLDVIFHLVEDDAFDDYMQRLFAAARRYVLIYSSDHDEEQRDPHVRHRRFTTWVKRHAPGWSLARRFDQPFKRTPTTNPRHTTYSEFHLFADRGTG